MSSKVGGWGMGRPVWVSARYAARTGSAVTDIETPCVSSVGRLMTSRGQQRVLLGASEAGSTGLGDDGPGDVDRTVDEGLDPEGEEETSRGEVAQRVHPRVRAVRGQGPAGRPLDMDTGAGVRLGQPGTYQ